MKLAQGNEANIDIDTELASKRASKRRNVRSKECPSKGASRLVQSDLKVGLSFSSSAADPIFPAVSAKDGLMDQQMDGRADRAFCRDAGLHL